MKRFLGVLCALLLVFSLAAVVLPLPVLAILPSEVWVDDDNCPGPGSGTQLDPFCKIQDGIDAVASPGTVHVASGNYSENIILKSGIVVQGAGADATTIDGSGTGDVVTAADNCTISRFTITNSGPPGYAGIRCYYSSPAINNNKITGNGGRGIFCYYSNANISSNIIGNNGDWGIWQNYSSPAISNNVIFGHYGGIKCANSSNPRITNNTIAENTATGISCDIQCSPSITNNIITGSGIWGIICEGSSFPKISYNDVWHNGKDYTGCSAGIGDISADPMFVDAPGDDYHLQSGSPCIDKGTNAGAPTEDIAGNLRPIDGDGILGAVTDMGAYEYVPPLPPPVEVGGEVHPVNKLAVLAPWIVLVAALLVGTSIAVVLRRRRAQS